MTRPLPTSSKSFERADSLDAAKASRSVSDSLCKKLLIVTDAWAPQINGVAMTLGKTKQLLEQKGFNVTLVHPGLFSNVPLPCYPEIRVSLFSKRLIGHLIAKDRPDYIHIATEGPLGLVARSICRRAGLRFTTSFHTHFQLYAVARFPGFLGPVYRYLAWFHSAAEKTMVATVGLRDVLAKAGFRNLEIWPLGVDTNLFARNTSQAVPFPKPVFTYFGRLAVEKNPEEFLDLDLPGTKLVIGDGPIRGRLQSKHGSSAIFLGYKQGKELVDWLSLSNVLVFPSRTETFGLVLLEALACGVAVAAHDVMGPRDILTPGVDGFLHEDLRIAATKCLDLSPAACRAKALKYSWEVSTDAFVSNLVDASPLRLWSLQEGPSFA